MTANKRQKRRARARAAKTGESYTAALRHLRRAEEERMLTFELRPGGATDIGNVRATNQDHFLVEGGLVAVADGMGGHAGGEVASRLAVETLRQRFAADPTATGLVQAVMDANQAVWDEAQADPGLTGMGTTLAAVALVSEQGAGRLVVVHVGDSRAYLLAGGGRGPGGELRRLTVDHSLVAELVRAGALTEEDARSHPRRHILTRALGVGPDLEPSVLLAEPARGDRLLLCSDGVYNELTDDEITEVLRTVVDPGEAADELVARAKDHGGHDNMTAAVVDIG